MRLDVHSDPGSEEVGIFGPDRSRKGRGCRQNWPVVFVKASQTQPGILFKFAKHFPINGLNEQLNVFER